MPSPFAPRTLRIAVMSDPFRTKDAAAGSAVKGGGRVGNNGGPVIRRGARDAHGRPRRGQEESGCLSELPRRGCVAPPMKSTWFGIAQFRRSSWSFSVIVGRSTMTPGRLQFLRSLRRRLKVSRGKCRISRQRTGALENAAAPDGGGVVADGADCSLLDVARNHRLRREERTR